MKWKLFLVVMSWAVLCAAAAPASAGNQVKGAKTCKYCHEKPEVGGQYAQWKKTKHAQAYRTLGTDKARAIAKKMGIAGDPQSAKECTVCHTTLWDDAGNKNVFGKKFKVEDGVQCENCHGAGGKYWSKKVMKRITKEGGAKRSPTAKRTGMKTAGKSTCKRCHTAKLRLGGVTYINPSFKSFDFPKRFKEITHLRPKK